MAWARKALGPKFRAYLVARDCARKVREAVEEQRLIDMFNELFRVWP
jgi:hypothetical protein